MLRGDYFSAHRKYMDMFDVQIQFCIAHLIRDVKFLLTLPDQRTQSYGKRLRDAIRTMFEVIHRRDEQEVGCRISNMHNVGDLQSTY